MGAAKLMGHLSGYPISYQGTLSGALSSDDMEALDACDVVVFMCTITRIAADETVGEILHYSYEAQKRIIVVFVEDLRSDLRLALQIVVQNCPHVNLFEAAFATALMELKSFVDGA